MVSFFSFCFFISFLLTLSWKIEWAAEESAAQVLHFLGKPEFCCASLYLEALTCEAVSKTAVTAFHDAERLEVSVFYLPSHPGGLKENYESTAPSPGAQKELQ